MYNKLAMKPRYSVIIPTLNEEKFVSKLLTSLVEQSVQNFEVIVVDGKSQDKTIVVARRFIGKLPLTVVSSDMPGVSRQRNMGAKIAKADWLMFVDADSVLLPNFMERIGLYIDKKQSKFFTTWLKADSDDPGDAIAGFILNMGVEGGILVDKPWAPGPLTVVYRDVFEQVHGYNEDVTYGEDHELGVAICRRGIPFGILREILYVYSFRRFRKEGNLKIFHRTLKSNLSILLTHKGLAHMPGFIGGGSIYSQSQNRKKKESLFFKKLALSVKKVIVELFLD